MTIFDLKNQIESKNLPNSLVIFSGDKIGFITDQYIHQIAKDKGLSIGYYHNLDTILYPDIFIESVSELKVLKLEEFNFADDSLFTQHNLIICCSKVEKNTQTLYNNYIVDVPELTQENITEYVYSVLETIDHSKLDWLIKICNGDIYRIQQEIDKLTIFEKNEQKFVFDQFIRNHMFDDLSAYSIFNVTNAIMKKDLNTLSAIYKEIDLIDINEIGFITVLFKNFFDVIRIQLAVNPSAESLGYSSKQYAAIRYNCGYYSKDALLKIFELLSSLDRQIKTGEFPVSIIKDYLITKILTL